MLCCYSLMLMLVPCIVVINSMHGMACNICTCNVTKCLFGHRHRISTMLHKYIHQHDHGVFNRGIDGTVNRNPMRCFEKRLACLILTACSVTKNSCEFILCRNFPDAICRHIYSSCFFSHHCTVIKNFA